MVRLGKNINPIIQTIILYSARLKETQNKGDFPGSAVDRSHLPAGMHVWPWSGRPHTTQQRNAHHHSWACAPAPTAATEAWGPGACKHSEGAPVLDCWPRGLGPRSATGSHCGGAQAAHLESSLCPPQPGRRTRGNQDAQPRQADRQLSKGRLHHCRKAAGLWHSQNHSTTSSDNSIRTHRCLKMMYRKNTKESRNIFLWNWFYDISGIQKKRFSIFLELHYKGKTARQIHTEFSHLMTRYHYDRYKGNSRDGNKITATKISVLKTLSDPEKEF